MKKVKSLLSVLCLSAVLPLMGQKMDKDKSRLIEHIEQQQQEMTTISDSIWAAAEVAFEEFFFSDVFSNYS